MSLLVVYFNVYDYQMDTYDGEVSYFLLLSNIRFSGSEFTYLLSTFTFALTSTWWGSRLAQQETNTNDPGDAGWSSFSVTIDLRHWGLKVGLTYWVNGNYWLVIQENRLGKPLAEIRPKKKMLKSALNHK